MGIKEMSAFARKIVANNTGYDQFQRWSFFNRKTKTFYSGKEADCSSFCGAVAVMGGYDVDLSDPFFTGTFKSRLQSAGFTAIPYKNLSQLREGDFILGPTHVEYCLGDHFVSARIDERGRATGGRAGNQNGRETRISNKYVHSRGWTWILRPPVSFVVNKNKTASKKSINDVAREVINGRWGNGNKRKDSLERAGYSYSEVQAAVNNILKGNVKKHVGSRLGLYRVVTNGGRLNGRSGPGINYRRTMTAANSYILTIVDIKDGWAKSSGGHWYSMKYLKKV